MKIKQADIYVSLWVFVLPFAIIVLPLLFGCYNAKKAQTQFAKAALTYPKILSDNCAFYFPPKDSTIRDTTLITDTIFVDGLITADTVTINDTVRITTIKTLPGKVITNTIHVTDTVYRENSAKLRSCEIDKSNLIQQLGDQTKKTDIAQSKATKRGRIMWSLIGLILLVIGYNIWRRFKPLAK